MAAKKYVSKTKAYTFDINPAYSSDVNMEVERLTIKNRSNFYFNPPRGSIDNTSYEALRSLINDCFKQQLDSAILVHTRIYKNADVNFLIANYQIFIISETLESDKDYEERRARVIKGRLAAEKRKLNGKEKEILKDSETLKKLLVKHQIEGEELLNQLLKKADESKV